jgi:vesicular inhibitory amino acid transporter
LNGTEERIRKREKKILKMVNSSRKDNRFEYISYGAIENEIDERSGPSLLEEEPKGGKCTTGETMINIVKVVVGSGMLSLPFAAKSMGWSGIIVLLLLGSIFLYSFDLLAEAIDIYRSKHNNRLNSTHSTFMVDYIALSREGFGDFGEKLVLTLFSVGLLLPLMSFFINIGLNLNYIAAPSLSVSGGIITSACISLFLSLFELNVAAIASSFGLTLTFFIIFALFWSGSSLDFPPEEKEYDILNMEGVSMSLGLIAFCFGGHATL